MAKESVDETLRRLADRNDQLVSRPLALKAGISPAALARRIGALLVPVHSGVYRMHGADDTFVRRVRAAVLAIGPTEAVVCRRAAATLAQYPEVEPVVEVAVPREKRVRIPGVTTIRSANFGENVWRHRGLVIHSDPRVVVDLAAVVSHSQLELVVDHGLMKRLFSLDQLEYQLDLLNPRRRTGIAALRVLIEARRPTKRALFMSKFEQRLYRLIEGSGLPFPKRQHRVNTASGKRFLDFAYPDAKIYIEAQSYQHHGGRMSWSADAVRGNDLTVLGWRRIDVTVVDLEVRPDQVVAWIRAALAAARTI